MKAAIITPIPLLERYGTLGDNYHLMLCHLADKSKAYQEFYKSRVEAGDFVILDNSAHEFGVGRGVDRLIEVAKAVGCQELVLPDRLFFGDDTLHLSSEAYKQIKTILPNVRVMGVPQGRTVEEYMNCMKGLVSLGVNTLGISKDYEVWAGGLAGMVSFANVIAPKVEIHLLGWGRDLKALFEIGGMTHLKVRGVDSAKPLVYAWDCIKLPRFTSGPVIEYPRRPENFFDLTEQDINEEVAVNNINVFKLWARGGTEL